MNPKLPHWLLVAFSLAAVVVAWSMKAQASGDLSLPQWAITVLTAVNALLGLFSGSALSGKASAASSRGFARARIVAALAVAGILAAFVFAPRRPAPRQSEVVQVAGEAAAMVQGEGCAWWNGGGSNVVAQQGAATLACELAQVESTGSVTVGGLLSCVGGVFGYLVSDLESLLAYYASGADGGVSLRADGMVCAAPGSKPPYAGAPACITQAAYSALEAKRGEAVSRMRAESAK